MAHTIATTILAQLGGGRLALMTGAKAFTGHADGLSFRLPGGGGFCKSGINYVRVTLNAMDTYDIEFSTIRARRVTVKSTASDVYADQLQDVFTSHTGLATSLGTMGRRS